LFSSSEYEFWRIWDFFQARPVSSIQTENSLNAICLINDNSQLITGNLRGQVEIWRISDGKLIIISYLDGNVIILHLAESEITDIRKIEIGTVPITRVATSLNGACFATAAADLLAKKLAFKTESWR
jgi:WD40 repeat protein